MRGFRSPSRHINWCAGLNARSNASVSSGTKLMRMSAHLDATQSSSVCKSLDQSKAGAGPGATGWSGVAGSMAPLRRLLQSSPFLLRSAFLDQKAVALLIPLPSSDFGGRRADTYGRVSTRRPLKMRPETGHKNATGFETCPILHNH